MVLIGDTEVTWTSNGGHITEFVAGPYEGYKYVWTWTYDDDALGQCSVRPARKYER
jgi:hypothetical protein